MNKDKQIEEMCAIMADASYAACEDTPLVPESAGICDKVDCHRCKAARRLMNAGYRKASDVAREFIEAVDSMMECITAMTGCRLTYYGKYAELKKKYEVEA